MIIQLDGTLDSIMRIKMPISELLTACHKRKSSPSLFKTWNYNTKRNNMQEILLLYARLNLQVVYY